MLTVLTSFVHKQSLPVGRIMQNRTNYSGGDQGGAVTLTDSIPKLRQISVQIIPSIANSTLTTLFQEFKMLTTQLKQEKIILV